ncbi:unnamed protein product [Heligmosomoides polygyrus]|uniref:Non-structural maintenance of chromosomes element 4 n=1 Tax=Heligmosomoides polygyrus TaxID=6339 RepID=A0A183FYW9_HELPZ|nr:unnamed protein product [Heligmosomoides polygyrus]
MDHIDEEYDHLVHHLRDSAKGAENFKTTKRHLFPESLELIRQRGAARVSGNNQLMLELAKLCRAAIKEDLNERRAEVLAEAAEAGLSIRNARRNFDNFKTKMTALRRPDGAVTASRWTMEKVIHDFYSDLFDSNVHLPPCHLPQDGYVVPSVLPSEIRHAVVLQLNLAKTMFMRKGQVSDASFSLNGTNVSECSSYVYLAREVYMANDLAPELSRRKRAA